MGAPDEISSDDCILSSGCPASEGSLSPSQEQVSSAVGAGCIVMPWSQILVLDHIVAHGRRSYILRESVTVRKKMSRSQYMYINVLSATPALPYCLSLKSM